MSLLERIEKNGGATCVDRLSQEDREFCLVTWKDLAASQKTIEGIQ